MLRFPDGSYYNGDWFEGAKCGVGVFQFNDGEKYEGRWFGDKKNGIGRY